MLFFLSVWYVPETIYTACVADNTGNCACHCYDHLIYIKCIQAIHGWAFYTKGWKCERNDKSLFNPCFWYVFRSCWPRWAILSISRFHYEQILNCRRSTPTWQNSSFTCNFSQFWIENSSFTCNGCRTHCYGLISETAGWIFPIFAHKFVWIGQLHVAKIIVIGQISVD